MPARARVSARKRAPAASLPGGVVGSIARYARGSSMASWPTAGELHTGGGTRWRRLADVHVRARRLAGDRAAEGEERYALRAQPRDQRLALGAVGMHRDVERVAVVEAETVVHRRLAERAHRQRAVESVGEEALQARQRPDPRPVKA